jgi:hypothetical protein
LERVGMIVEQTAVSSSVHAYAEALTALACEELGIPRPEIRWFRYWRGEGSFWRDVPDGALGFTRPREGFIAIQSGIHGDRVTHVVLHELRHCAQGPMEEQASESDACEFARDFEERRALEILGLMNVHQPLQDLDLGTGSGRCWCEGVAYAY